MTQQTPHERALEAAISDLGAADEFNHWMLDYGNLNHFIAKYLTTLLDSPEMVEIVAKEIFFAHGSYGEKAKAVIAAIKKETGV